MTEEARQDVYAALAVRAVERALSKMRDGLDAAPELSLAAAAWSAAMGEASDDIRADLDEYELTADSYQLRRWRECTCPPELHARGGFRSGCPEHGVITNHPERMSPKWQ